MHHSQKCQANCPNAATAVGKYVCAGGWLFGHSTCAAAGSGIHAKDVTIVAGVALLGLNTGTTTPEELKSALKSSLATSLGVPASSIVRLALKDLVAAARRVLQDTTAYEASSPRLLQGTATHELTYEIAIELGLVLAETVRRKAMQVFSHNSALNQMFSQVLRNIYGVALLTTAVAIEPIIVQGQMMTTPTPAPIPATTNRSQPNGTATLPMQTRDGDATMVASVVISALMGLPLLGTCCYWCYAECRRS